MNYDALQLVRDAMATDRTRIDMRFAWGDRVEGDSTLANHGDVDTLFAGTVFASCDTVGCIAGWTVATLDPSFPVIEFGEVTPFTAIAERAAELLGMDSGAAGLFYAYWAYPTKLNRITPGQVIAHLDRLLAERPIELAEAA